MKPFWTSTASSAESAGILMGHLVDDPVPRLLEPAGHQHMVEMRVEETAAAFGELLQPRPGVFGDRLQRGPPVRAPPRLHHDAAQLLQPRVARQRRGEGAARGMEQRISRLRRLAGMRKDVHLEPAAAQDAPHLLEPRDGALGAIGAHLDAGPSVQLNELVDAAERAARLAGAGDETGPHAPEIDATALAADRFDDLLVQL